MNFTMETYFSIDAMVRGYHVYKDVWESEVGEVLACEVEMNNIHDRNAIAVKKANDVVGHLPKKISLICRLFLEREDSSIQCEVASTRRYSRDLPQGGLEIPCRLHFCGNSTKAKEASLKAQKLVHMALKSTFRHIGCDEKNNKPDDSVVSVDSTECWVRFGSIVLSFAEKVVITSCQELNDLHINFAQEIFKQQSPYKTGFNSTLLVSSRHEEVRRCPEIQILHVRNNHWCVASSIMSADGVVVMYDSLYDSLDSSTLDTLQWLYGQGSRFHVANISKQNGIKDCGLYAIAIAVLLINKVDPHKVRFVQEKMRDHLITCFEAQYISFFPCHH